MNTVLLESPAWQQRFSQILKEHQDQCWRQTDQLFIGLLFFQYLCGIVLANWATPETWEGISSQKHPHIWAATYLGAVIVMVPLVFAGLWPAQFITRHVIAAGQMLNSALIIHLFGGRIETHFHIFGSLAFLAFYRDWTVLVTATIVIGCDHICRGIFWPLSVFGVLTAGPARAMEHVVWVLFEDAFLIWSCRRAAWELRNLAGHQVTLESTNEKIEEVVSQRTADLAKSQRDLVRSKDALRAIIETAADGIITMDASGKIQSINRAAEHLFYYTADEILGQNINLLFVLTDERRIALSSSEIADNCPFGSFYHTSEMIGRRRGGATVPIDVSLSEVYIEGERRLTVIVREISAQKEAEAVLAEKARLEAFAAEIGRNMVGTQGLSETLKNCADAIATRLDAAFVQIWTIDDETHELVEGATTAIFTQIDGPNGWNSKKGFEVKLIAEERIPYLSNKVVGDVRVGNHEWARREGIVAFAGHPLMVDERVMGVMSIFARHTIPETTFCAMGSVINSIAVGIDRVRAEERLKLAMNAAKQASIIKSQFLANMSHELRTPMNAIIGYSEMLAEEVEEDGSSQYLPDLQKIQNAGKHLLTLINDILDVSKIEAGKMELSIDEFDLGLLLDDIISTIMPMIKKRSNTLVAKSSGDLGRVSNDQTKIRQILLNLLSNAAKFTEGGTITLHARRMTRQGSTYLEFVIRDTGIGMTDAQLKRVGEPFLQAESSSSNGFGGTGLGLTITKRFCEMMGGQLVVSSKLGCGTTFEVLILANPADSTRDETLQPLDALLSKIHTETQTGSEVKRDQQPAPNEPEFACP